MLHSTYLLLISSPTSVIRSFDVAFTKTLIVATNIPEPSLYTAHVGRLKMHHAHCPARLPCEAERGGSERGGSVIPGKRESVSIIQIHDVNSKKVERYRLREIFASPAVQVPPRPLRVRNRSMGQAKNGKLSEHRGMSIGVHMLRSHRDKS